MFHTLGLFFGHKLSFVLNSGDLVLFFFKSHLGFVFEILSGLGFVHGSYFSLVLGLESFHSHSFLLIFKFLLVRSSFGMSELLMESSCGLLLLDLKLTGLDHLGVFHLLLFHE